MLTGAASTLNTGVVKGSTLNAACKQDMWACLGVKYFGLGGMGTDRKTGESGKENW